MTETLLSSPTKEVVIGFDRPFVIIGERINPTGRKKLAEEMAAGNFDTVVADAIATASTSRLPSLVMLAIAVPVVPTATCVIAPDVMLANAVCAEFL